MILGVLCIDGVGGVGSAPHDSDFQVGATDGGGGCEFVSRMAEAPALFAWQVTSPPFLPNSIKEHALGSRRSSIHRGIRDTFYTSVIMILESHRQIRYGARETRDAHLKAWHSEAA